MKFIKLIKSKKIEDYKKDPSMPYYVENDILYDNKIKDYQGQIDFGPITEDNYKMLGFRKDQIGKYFVIAFDMRTDEEFVHKVFKTEEQVIEAVETIKVLYAND